MTVSTRFAALVGVLLLAHPAARAVTLGVRGPSFTINGKPAFLVGISYYAGLGASKKTWKSDLNWSLDLSNERNIRDARYTPIGDLSRLRDEVKRLDPNRLVTASHGGDISRDELLEYINTAHLDFVCPHRPRDKGSAAQTEA